ncbi:MAG: hypothetical protein MO847_09720, partial [Candidatus Protistobacter heckmanni]|nr:hypothetical protein [Candidatus Protistobacter heckmanni]
NKDSTRKEGKLWVPKPSQKDEPAAEVRSRYQAFMDELDRMVKKVQENEYAMLRLKAAQLAEKEGIEDLTAAYDKINVLQRSESQKAVDDYTRRLEKETAQIDFQNSILGLSAQEQAKLTAAMQQRLEMERLLEQAKTSGKPLDDRAIADIRAQTEATILLRQAQQDQARAIQRTGEFGFHQAMNDYIDGATNMAAQIKNAVTNAFKGMEDALVNFVKTGKLDFRSLADSIISDLIRIQIQQSIVRPLAGWIGSVVGAALGGSSGGAVVDSTATQVVTPNAFAANGGIMTTMGMLPLNKYSSGGIATSPQLAVFGEGRMNEAYVPLPDGCSIPVTMTGGGGGGDVFNISVSVSNAGTSASGDDAGGRNIGRAVANAVRQELLAQRRAGGLLDPRRAA